ncbi:hypothetical protein GQ53DRAFT_624971, partial [Thozetella sp. PMI_491]
DLPPPYTETFSTGSSAGGSGPSRIPGSFTDSLTAPLAAHIHALPDRMRATEQAHSTQQAAFDLDLITLLIPRIETFLSDLGAMAPSPPVAELTLVPAAAVPKGSTLSGALERRREGEVLRVVRVEAPKSQASKGGKGGGEKGSSLPSTVSTTWWWQDERMARRLAAYLQPKPRVRVERREIQAIVEKAKEEKKSGWGWRRKRTEDPPPGPPAAAPAPAVAPVGLDAPGPLDNSLDDRVSMTVRTEEVTFRRENEFGIWESLTGFGLVVAIRI